MTTTANSTQESKDTSKTKWLYDTILMDVIAIVKAVQAGWEDDFGSSITRSTCLLNDLAYDSVGLVELSIELESHFGVQGLPFAKLVILEGGGHVDTLTIETLVDFLYLHLNER